MAAKKKAPTKEPLTTCPYTGEEFIIVPLLGKAGGWRPEGLLNPLVKFDTEAEAIATLCKQRNGKKVGQASYKCPYLGTKFTIEQNPRSGKWGARGSFFLPSKKYATRQEARFELSRRKGVDPDFEKVDPVITTSPRERDFNGETLKSAIKEQGKDALNQEAFKDVVVDKLQRINHGDK
jgi:N-acyl-D-aspartate/D-glutamate deacylase